MNAISSEEITKLPDRDLVDRIHTLADREREAKAALITHLAIMDERRLYLGEGCSSLFTYCVRVLHFSGAAAYRRVEAAHAARRFPAILDMLSTGQINVTTIRLLAPELTPTNHQDLLKKATHHSRLEVEKIVAHLRPQAPVPSTVRQLPTRTAAPVSHPLRGEGSEAAADATLSVSGTFPTLVRPAAPPVVVPLSPNSYKIQFTASEETHDLLRRAQDLLRQALATSRPRCGARCGNVMLGSVRSWRRTADAGLNTRSLSFTTSYRMPQAEKPPTTTSNCGAGPTTPTRPRSLSS